MWWPTFCRDTQYRMIMIRLIPWRSSILYGSPQKRPLCMKVISMIWCWHDDGRPISSQASKFSSSQVPVWKWAFVSRSQQRFREDPVYPRKTRNPAPMSRWAWSFRTWLNLVMSFPAYWWSHAYEEVKTYIQSRSGCQIFDRVPPKDKSPNKFPVIQLFERFALDYVGPLPVSISGNKHILVAPEYFTKWPIVKALQKADQDTTAKSLYEDLYCQFGPPVEFLTDNGIQFDNQAFTKFCSLVNAHHKFSAPYHPQTNGLVEWFNGTLMTGLKKLSMSFPRRWDDHIPAVLYAYVLAVILCWGSRLMN